MRLFRIPRRGRWLSPGAEQGTSFYKVENVSFKSLTVCTYSCLLTLFFLRVALVMRSNKIPRAANPSMPMSMRTFLECMSVSCCVNVSDILTPV
mmetsp:Transcript_20029/g.43302  ORF Transcript_20029/g.43302 Transcript_20029/m.43302 type:complete len:94 (+) Transcript_20029:1285-1566(+)